MTEEYEKKSEREKEGWQRAINYVKKNEQDLRRIYGTDYIAVMEDFGVIDRDTNILDLLKRMRINTHTKKSILINSIEGILNRTPIIMDSPELGVRK